MLATIHLRVRLSCWYLTVFKYTQLYSFPWARNFASCFQQEQSPVEKIRTYEGASTECLKKCLQNKQALLKVYIQQTTCMVVISLYLKTTQHKQTC